MTEAARLRWDAEGLWLALVPLLPGVSVEVVAKCDSTNTRLIERARAASGDPDAPITRPGQLDPLGDDRSTPHGRRARDLEPCLLVAEQQTRGRGRLGRGWVSAPVASLTFSLSLPLEPREWSGLSLAVGLALAEALDPVGARIGLKWPNDLWLRDEGGKAGPGRKLGGILIETVSVGRRRMCVVGIGLNVRAEATAGVEGLEAASVQELDADAQAPAVLARIVAPLVQALKAFERDGFAPLVERYALRDVLAGRAVSSNAADAPEGLAEGVDASGALRLRTADGTLQRIVSGEVSVRLAAPPGPADAAPGAA
jgi:BirA family transcriptional regulator, biotin operon repressor / biotin---[acetyl-CoA-carboxylase] ligase